MKFIELILWTKETKQNKSTRRKKETETETTDAATGWWLPPLTKYVEGAVQS